MTDKFLFQQIQKKASFLCVGLDIDLEKIPHHLGKEEDPIFVFAKAIIDATNQFSVAYKLNLAFFEAYGIKGWQAFKKVINYLNSQYPNHFTIADAKRGDIGNTSQRYANSFFQVYGFDAVTVSPYMGKDAVTPFLSYKEKYAILLALTSNSGAQDFQYTKENDKYLYEKVLQSSLEWENSDRLMYVVGATKSESLISIRKLVPNSFLLIPGIGAQGGSLSEVAQNGMNHQCGLLVNSSRGIIYASENNDFAEAAASQSKTLQTEMAAHLKSFGLI
jgi:orotidine-5'-phosphate decarboxylase